MYSSSSNSEEKKSSYQLPRIVVAKEFGEVNIKKMGESASYVHYSYGTSRSRF